VHQVISSIKQAVHTKSEQNKDWKEIADALGGTHTAEECKEWYSFLSQLDDYFVEPIKQNADSSDATQRSHTSSISLSTNSVTATSSNELSSSTVSLDSKSNETPTLKKRRVRKKAILIDRKWKCWVADCPRAYGTENALKFHIKTKHPQEKYTYSFSRSLFGSLPNLSLESATAVHNIKLYSSNTFLSSQTNISLFPFFTPVATMTQRPLSLCEIAPQQQLKTSLRTSLAPLEHSSQSSTSLVLNSNMLPSSDGSPSWNSSSVSSLSSSLSPLSASTSSSLLPSTVLSTLSLDSHTTPLLSSHSHLHTHSLLDTSLFTLPFFDSTHTPYLSQFLLFGNLSQSSLSFQDTPEFPPLISDEKHNPHSIKE
jgi:hypothetical protein